MRTRVAELAWAGNIVIMGIAVMAIGAAITVWETHAEHTLVLDAAQEAPSIETLSIVEATERGSDRGKIMVSADGAFLSGKLLDAMIAGGGEEYTRFLPEALPRIDIEHRLPEDERTCPHHGVELERFGEVVSEQLDIIPMQVRVLRHVRGKYRCPCCEGHHRDNPAVHAAGQGDGVSAQSVEGARAFLRRRALRHRHQPCRKCNPSVCCRAPQLAIRRYVSEPQGDHRAIDTCSEEGPIAAVCRKRWTVTRSMYQRGASALMPCLRSACSAGTAIPRGQSKPLASGAGKEHVVDTARRLGPAKSSAPHGWVWPTACSAP